MLGLSRLSAASFLFVSLTLTACSGSDESNASDDDAGIIGDGATPPSSSDGGDASVTPRTPPKSCTGGIGANASCGGVDGDDTKPGSHDCCSTIGVPGGTFDQFNDARYPATVSPYLLDEFEVTNGRFRAWVEASGGNLRASAPAPGAGAHPKIANSGWRAEWNASLPASRTEIDQMLGPEKCQVGQNLDDYGALTWWTPALDAKVKASNGGNAKVLAENTKDALDAKALNCVPWQVLFAFCVWDGGRLPTNAEWGFASAGGSEQREFAWGAMNASQLANVGAQSNLSPAPLYGQGDPFLVAFLWDKAAGPNAFPQNYAYTWGSAFANPHDNASHIAPVGRRVKGNGKWGHADLAGGMYEWMLDEGPIRPAPCTDCGNVDWPAPGARDPKIPTPFPLKDFEDKWFVGGARAIRGGAWDNALGLSNAQTQDEIDTYTSYPVLRTYRSLGGRCARDL